MKKLMVALAVVAMATASQAAMWDWKVKGDSSMDGQSFYTVLGDFSKASFATLADIESVALEQYTATPPAPISTTIAKSGRDYTANGTINDSDVIRNGSQAFYYVLVDKTYDGGKGGYVVYDGGTIKGYDTAFGDSKNTLVTATIGGGSYTAFNVPEPTSGLLLLLGVAGMALRRRRA